MSSWFSIVVARVAPLMQLQPPLVSAAYAFVTEAWNFSRHDFPALFFSQASSAVSSASFPLDRLAWHLMTHATALLTAFATLASHLPVSDFGSGMLPVSSPPNGVPGDRPHGRCRRRRRRID